MPYFDTFLSQKVDTQLLTYMNIAHIEMLILKKVLSRDSNKSV